MIPAPGVKQVFIQCFHAVLEGTVTLTALYSQTLEMRISVSNTLCSHRLTMHAFFFKFRFSATRHCTFLMEEPHLSLEAQTPSGLSLSLYTFLFTLTLLSAPVLLPADSSERLLESHLHLLNLSQVSPSVSLPNSIHCWIFSGVNLEYGSSGFSRQPSHSDGFKLWHSGVTSARRLASWWQC